MIDNDAKFYAKFMKKLRKKEELSLKKFGELFYVSGQAISDIENGKTKKPNEKLISEIANYLNEEESKIYNEIYYGKSNHKSSPFNHDEFFKSLLDNYFKENNVNLIDGMEVTFNNDIDFFYDYIYSLKADWVMRYDTEQMDYMVRAIHYFDRRNIAYIITWNFAQIKYDFQIKQRNHSLEIENIFLHSMFEIMKSEKEKPRTFTIVFNAKEEEQVFVYNYLTNLKFSSPKFFIQFILYDVENKTMADKIYK